MVVFLYLTVYFYCSIQVGHCQANSRTIIVIQLLPIVEETMVQDSALVTGCAGFIGSHTAEELLERGYKVTGIDNLRTGKKENMSSFIDHPSFEFLEADICSKKLDESIEDCLDFVFHLAAISSVKLSVEKPLLINTNNLNGTLRVLETAKACGAKRFVFSSSAAIYGDPASLPVKEDAPIEPMSPYAASKAAAEQYIKSYQQSYNLKSTILRYFNVYGPRQAYSEYSGVVSIFINQALTGKNLTIDGDGKQTRSMIHVKDVVRATIGAACEKNTVGETINISGQESISIADMAETIRGLVSSSKSDIVHTEPREGDVRHSIGDITKAKDLLGFTPEISFQEGVEDTIEWYREH
ncbi:MAG: NAD-dependent epimerase/dehydratase family protein [Candidatus Lokiarchaeota archaeon]|nr:NAD-dependent epimerase/dehydratase family protein [Candidatus Lokiarchaeota archaeon]